MERTVRVWFTDFWINFDHTAFWIYRMLKMDFEVILDPLHPQLLIFCTYGVEHLRYKCCKVYYSHENTVANPRLCDFSFCFNGRGAGHQFFSNLVEEEYFEEIMTRQPGPQLAEWKQTPKTKFCNFIYSNTASQPRIRFCLELMKYKRVDCPGRALNNQPPFDSHGYKYDAKFRFLKDYRFTIAFENESALNYTTEKILHAYIGGGIPIYWGNPNVAALFNPRSFINCHDFPSFAAVIAHVKAVDSDPALFASYTSAPPILPGSPLMRLTTDYLRSRLDHIVVTALSARTISHHSLYSAVKAYHFLRNRLENRFWFALQLLETKAGITLIKRPRV